MTPAADEIGAVLPSRYVLDPDAAAGDAGVVAARDRARAVAVDVHAAVIPAAGARRRAADEARPLARLRHPHLAGVVDVIDTDPLLLVVTDAAPGRPMGTADRPVAPEVTCALGLAVAGVLADAHRHGIVHARLRPAAIRLGPDATPRVVGLAVTDVLERAAAGDTTARLGPGSDLYSLALVLHWLLGGDIPPRRGDSTLFPGLDEAPAAVLRRAADLDVARRHPSAHAFAVDLAGAAAQAFGPGWPGRTGVVLHLDDDVRAAADRLAPARSPTAARRLAPLPVTPAPAVSRPSPVPRPVAQAARPVATGPGRGAPLGSTTGAAVPAATEPREDLRDGTAAPTADDAIGSEVPPPRRAGMLARPRGPRLLAAAALTAVLAVSAAVLALVLGRAGPGTDVPRPVLTGHTGAVLAVAISGRGPTLASGGQDGTVRLWNLADPARASPLGEPISTPAVPVLSLAFSPDGRVLAAGTGDGALRLWDVADPRAPRPLLTLLDPDLAGAEGTRAGTNSVAFSADGRRLAAATTTGAPLLWDVSTPARPVRLGVFVAPDGRGNPLAMRSLVLNADASAAAGVDGSGAFWLWALPRRGGPRLLAGPVAVPGTAGTGQVLFSPAGGILAGDTDNAVRLWDVTDPAAPRQIGEPLTPADDAGPVGALAFSPDGHTLATGNADGGIRAWDVSDPARPHPAGTVRAGHAEPVTALAYSPDGGLLASASSDRTVRLWRTGS